MTAKPTRKADQQEQFDYDQEQLDYHRMTILRGGTRTTLDLRKVMAAATAQDVSNIGVAMEARAAALAMVSAEDDVDRAAVLEHLRDMLDKEISTMRNSWTFGLDKVTAPVPTSARKRA